MNHLCLISILYITDKKKCGLKEAMKRGDYQWGILIFIFMAEEDKTIFIGFIPVF